MANPQGAPREAGKPVWHLVDGFEDDPALDQRRTVTRCGIEHFQSIYSDGNKPWRLTEMTTRPNTANCPVCLPKERKPKLAAV